MADPDNSCETRSSASDVRVLLSAMRLGKPVVTQNKDDFLLLHEVWSSLKALWEAEVLLFTGAAVSFSTHAGIVIIPPIPIYDAAALLLDLTVAQPQLQGRCLRWLPQTGLQEPLPMSGAQVN